MMELRMIKWLSLLLIAGITCLSPAAARDGAGDAATDGAPTALTPFAPLSLEDSQLDQLDDALQRAMDSGDFVGLAVAVVRDGETKFLKT